jgi:hypothetical protein
MNTSTICFNLSFRKDTPKYITDFFHKGIKDERIHGVLLNHAFTFDNKPHFGENMTMICEHSKGRYYLYIHHKFDFDTKAAEGYWFSGGLAQYAEDDICAGYLKHSDPTCDTQVFSFKDQVPYFHLSK